jgi:hypothetical protein
MPEGDFHPSDLAHSQAHSFPPSLSGDPIFSLIFQDSCWSLSRTKIRGRNDAEPQEILLINDEKFD